MTSVRLTRACGILQRTFQSHAAATSAAAVTASSTTLSSSTIVNSLDHVLFSTRLSFSSSSAAATAAQKTRVNSTHTNYTNYRKDQDASTYMAGVTNEDVANNPTLSAFFQANFPEYFEHVAANNNNNNNGDDSSGDSSAVDPDAAKLAAFIESELEREKEEKQLLKQKRQSSTPLMLRSPISTPLQESKKENETENENETEKEVIITTPPNNIRPLWCYTRQKGAESGSRRCQELRNQPSGSALVPGILYGSDPTKGILSIDASSKTLVKTPWKLLQCELDRYTYHHFESRVYDLTIYDSEHDDDDDAEGTIHRVMPRDVQYHPIFHKVYCCNYLRYFPGKPISIPIEYINTEESAAMKRGGFIAPITRHVTCIVDDGVPIPEKIELECTDVKLKEVIREERLIFPEGVSMSPTVDRELFLVGTVFGRSSEVDEEEVVATEGEEEVKSGDA